MPEFVFRASEPQVIGEFNPARGQMLAEQLAPQQRSNFKTAFLTPDVLDEIDIDMFGIEPDMRDVFIASTNPYIENLPAVLRADQEPAADAVNKWHADSEMSIVNRQPVFNLCPVTIGSSSHSTEIICGDVVFKQNINRRKSFYNYLLTEVGQRAVNLAIQKGDAWIFEPEGEFLDGKIVRFNDPNLHRRNQSQPESPYRLVIRHHNVR